MRLKLADLFVKPMQRVTKYALLLKAILGKTSEEDEKSSLQTMVNIFYKQVYFLVGLIFHRSKFYITCQQ